MESEGIVRMVPTNCNCRHSGCERHHSGEQYYWRISFDRIGWMLVVRSQDKSVSGTAYYLARDMPII